MPRPFATMSNFTEMGRERLFSITGMPSIDELAVWAHFTNYASAISGVPLPSLLRNIIVEIARPLVSDDFKSEALAKLMWGLVANVEHAAPHESSAGRDLRGRQLPRDAESIADDYLATRERLGRRRAKLACAEVGKAWGIAPRMVRERFTQARRRKDFGSTLAKLSALYETSFASREEFLLAYSEDVRASVLADREWIRTEPDGNVAISMPNVVEVKEFWSNAA